MASIINRPNGRIKLHLEARLTNSAPDRDTARWVAELPPETPAKLAAVNKLVAERENAGAKPLGAFLVEYVASRADKWRFGSFIIAPPRLGRRPETPVSHRPAASFFAWEQRGSLRDGKPYQHQRGQSQRLEDSISRSRAA